METFYRATLRLERVDPYADADGDHLERTTELAYITVTGDLPARIRSAFEQVRVENVTAPFAKPGRAAEANQDSDGEKPSEPLVDLAALKEAIDRQPYEPSITFMSPEEYRRARTDPRWTGRKPEDAPTAWCGDPDHDDPCDNCDAILADASDALRQRMPGGGISASQSHVVTSGTSGLIIRPGSSHAAA